MPYLKPVRAANRVLLRRLAHRRVSSLVNSHPKGDSGPQPSPSTSSPPRPGRYPPSPLLQSRSSQPSPTDESATSSNTVDVSRISFSGWEGEVLEQGRQAGLSEVQVREVWHDFHARMMAGPTALCAVTGVKLPKSLLIDFRPARLPSLDEGGRESMILVPTGVLHPEWSNSEPEGQRNEDDPTLSVTCSDVVLARFAGTTKDPIRATDRFRMVSLPHSNIAPADQPQTPVLTAATGVTTVSSSLKGQVEHQLQMRVVQEAFLLAERIKRAGPIGPALLVEVGNEELETMRSRTWKEGNDDGGKILAVLDYSFNQDDIVDFFPSTKPRKPQSTVNPTVKMWKSCLPAIPSFATCPQIGRRTTFYNLPCLLSQDKLNLLFPLLDIISPRSAGCATRKLFMPSNLLSKNGIDLYPFFTALHRLALFLPHTLVWPAEQREKLWSLAWKTKDVELTQRAKEEEERRAEDVPFLKDGRRIDLQAVLRAKNKLYGNSAPPVRAPKGSKGGKERKEFGVR